MYQVIGIGITSTSFVTTPSQVIGPGIKYTFKVRARNAVGLSEDSQTITVLAAVRPTAPKAPTLTPAQADSIVVVSWQAEYDQAAAFGALIKEYHVFIKQKDGLYTEVGTDCPPTSQSLLMNTQCTVQVSRLRAAPFLLEHGDAIEAKVTQVNIQGESDMSAAGAGASIFVPVVPDAPINLYGAEITLSGVKLTWADGVYNGGKTVTAYSLEK